MKTGGELLTAMRDFTSVYFDIPTKGPWDVELWGAKRLMVCDAYCAIAVDPSLLPGIGDDVPVKIQSGVAKWSSAPLLNEGATHDTASLLAFAGLYKPKPACPTCKGEDAVACDECDGSGHGECECMTCGDVHHGECDACDGEGEIPCKTCREWQAEFETGMLLGVPMGIALLAKTFTAIGLSADDPALRCDVIEAGKGAPAVRFTSVDGSVVLLMMGKHPHGAPTVEFEKPDTWRKAVA